MDKYKNKYRIQSHRMPKWDYSGNGLYFITLVTQNRECNLGEIYKGEMAWSAFGRIVDNEWLKSFEIRRELFLDEYSIMPNHLHAIVVLDKTNHLNGTYETHVETHGRASLQSQSQSQSQSPILFRKPQSISSFIGGFKSSVNSKIDDFIDAHRLNIPKYNKNNHFFQSNYHDRVIRNEKEHQRIRKYIIANPSNWDSDDFN